MSILEIADELAALIEPDPALRDDARARPIEVLVDTLYLWPVRETYDPEDTGGSELERVELHAAWAADRLTEGEPERDVTEAVIERAEGLTRTVRAHRGGTSYEQMGVAGIDYESLRGFDVRGFEAVLVGYVQRSDRQEATR